ncbi:hypothetical protein [Paenibacillus sp. RC84]|uniref:hypothetical protein n=1 Tax=Paenibacillus sp. RC84 TaxID=3156252 RepID=UPI00351595C0
MAADKGTPKPGQVRYAEIDPPIESDTAIITLEHQIVSQAARSFKKLLIDSLH